MCILQKSEAGTEQEHSGKQIPLDFKKCIGADTKRFTSDSIACTNQCGRQYQPDNALSDESADLIEEL